MTETIGIVLVVVTLVGWWLIDHDEQKKHERGNQWDRKR